MKKGLLVILAYILSIVALAQNRTVVTDNIQIKNSVTIAGVKINGVSQDTSVNSQSGNLLMSEGNIKNLIYNRINLKQNKINFSSALYGLPYFSNDSLFVPTLWSSNGNKLYKLTGNIGLGDTTSEAKFYVNSGVGNEAIRIGSTDQLIGNRYSVGGEYGYPALTFYSYKDDGLQRGKSSEISFLDRNGTYGYTAAVRTSDIIFNTSHNWNGSIYGVFQDTSLWIRSMQKAGATSGYANFGFNKKRPDSVLDVVGGMRFNTGFQQQNYVLTSDSLGGAQWKQPTNIFSSLYLSKTIIPVGTTGAQTINTASGKVNFSTTSDSVVITNSLATANSIIVATVMKRDSTFKSCQVSASAGQFTMYPNARATSETPVSFIIIN